MSKRGRKRRDRRSTVRTTASVQTHEPSLTQCPEAQASGHFVYQFPSHYSRGVAPVHSYHPECSTSQAIKAYPDWPGSVSPESVRALDAAMSSNH